MKRVDKIQYLLDKVNGLLDIYRCNNDPEVLNKIIANLEIIECYAKILRDVKNSF